MSPSRVSRRGHLTTTKKIAADADGIGLLRRNSYCCRRHCPLWIQFLQILLHAVVEFLTKTGKPSKAHRNNRMPRSQYVEP